MQGGVVECRHLCLFILLIVKRGQQTIGGASVTLYGQHSIFQNLPGLPGISLPVQRLRPFLQGLDQQGKVLVVLGKSRDIGRSVGQL